MIKKNDQLRRHIDTQIQRTQDKTASVGINPTHALLLSIGQYRKQVTSLAVNSLKVQNRSAFNLQGQKVEKKEVLSVSKQNQPLLRVQKETKQSERSKTTQTKKKKYNYFLGDENQQASLERTQYGLNQKYSSLESNELNQMNKNGVKNCKSYSYINPNREQYLTSPFVLSVHEVNKVNTGKVQSKGAKQSDFDQVTLLKDHRPLSQNNYYKKLANQDKNTRQVNQNKSSLSVGVSKGSQHEKASGIPHQQKPSYPKTETYTSRSDYNIQKLKNKLDSYIKKHINHPV